LGRLLSGGAKGPGKINITLIYLFQREYNLLNYVLLIMILYFYICFLILKNCQIIQSYMKIQILFDDSSSKLFMLGNTGKII